MSFISLFKISKVVLEGRPEPEFFFFFLIPESIAEAAAVIPNFLLKELILSLMGLLIYLTVIPKTLQIQLF